LHKTLESIREEYAKQQGKASEKQANDSPKEQANEASEPVGQTPASNAPTPANKGKKTKTTQAVEKVESEK